MRVRAVQKLNVLKLRIQTRNLTKIAAADPHLSLRGHQDQPFWHLVDTKYNLMHKYLYSYNILYMFRASLCSSSGGSIVYVQHLVPSLSVSGCTLHWLTESSSLLTSVKHGRSQRMTVPNVVHIQLNLLKMSIIMLETCRGV